MRLRGCAIAGLVLCLGSLVQAQETTLRIRQTVTVQETDVDLIINLGLDVRSPTRLGFDAVVDLTELQNQIPALTLGKTLLDNCGARITLEAVEATGVDSRILVNGQLQTEFFLCERTGAADWARGGLDLTQNVLFRSEISAELVDQCVVLRLFELSLDTPRSAGRLDAGSARMQAVRGLLIEAAGLLLEENPYCPEFPEDLRILEPQYVSGMPVEIGEGGFGIGLRGSIDVSTQTTIAVLRLLQDRGVLPPPP